MRLNHVITRSLLLLIAAHLSSSFVSKARIHSKQNDVVLDKLGKRKVPDDDQYVGTEDNLVERNAADSHTRLLNYIKMVAQPFRLPMQHLHTPIEIHVRAALYQIVDLDQRNNIATISGYFDAWWIDPWLRWNASEFSNITKTFIPAKWFWKPEFYLYHSCSGFDLLIVTMEKKSIKPQLTEVSIMIYAVYNEQHVNIPAVVMFFDTSVQGRIPDYAPDAVAEVDSTGRLRIFIPVTARALCPINVKYFPFDTQNCTFADIVNLPKSSEPQDNMVNDAY